MRESARRMLVSAVCVLGLAAAAAPVLSTAAATPAAAASAAAGSTSLPTPGLYHQPIIGKVVLPGLGQVLGHGLRHATNVQSQNWSGYADNQDTYDSVAASWTQPAVNCSAGGGVGGGVLNGLLGGNGLGNLLGPGSSAASFWVGLDGYASNSVEQLGADSDCNGKTPTYYAWWEMFPNPSQVLSNAYPVHPGDQMTAWVASNGSGTTFYLALKDSVGGQERVQANEQYEQTGAVPYLSRTAAQVEGYFAGLDLVPPGVVPVANWRPDPSPSPPVQVDSLAGVGLKKNHA